VIVYRADTEKFRRTLKGYGRRFKDSNWQLTCRLAVSVARELAVLTEPRGKGKKAIVAAIEADARRAVVPLSARTFQAARRRGRIWDGRQYVAVPADRFLEDEDAVWRAIEVARGRGGRVRKGLTGGPAVTRRPVFLRVLRKRRKLAGIAKGSWLGAGMEAARFQRGAARLSIGRNFMSWAQKHARFGRARRRRRGWRAGIELVSLARHTRRREIFPVGVEDEAVARAFRNTANWYRRALKEAEKRA